MSTPPSHATAAATSRGHIGFLGDFEFYELDGQVYRAPIWNVFDVTTGARIGRWECSRPHFDRFRAVILGQEARS